MKTIKFCKKYKPCRDGRDFALRFEEMSEVWEKCEHPDWLFWILKKHKPLEKNQSVKLAVLFCRSILNLIPERSYKNLNKAEKYLGLELSVFDKEKYADSAAAAAAAYAADAAAAAYAYAYAADSAYAAYAAYAADSAYAAYAADSAYAYAYAAAAAARIKKRIELCNIIRAEIPNPFTL